jgi:hypothetical protein
MNLHPHARGAHVLVFARVAGGLEMDGGAGEKAGSGSIGLVFIVAVVRLARRLALPVCAVPRC